MTEAPPPNRQFLKVQFRPGDRRLYTYHNDGEPLGAGAQVKVPDRSGDGWTRVTVVEAFSETPTFATKPILGLAPEPGSAEATDNLLAGVGFNKSILDGLDDQ